MYKSQSTIKQVLEEVPEKTFIQIHRAYIVNKNKIEKFTAKNVVIRGVITSVTKPLN